MKPIASLFVCLALLSCTASGPLYRAPTPGITGNPSFVVYRISGVGGGMGAWVPTRVELDGAVVGYLPDRSFIAMNVAAGKVTLSATDKVDFRYADSNRASLRVDVSETETVYFRIATVYGPACSTLEDAGGIGDVAQVVHHFRHDSAQTTCFQRVSEALALEELRGLRDAK